MKRKTMIYLSVTAIFVLAGIFAWNTMARAAYESAEYKVVESDGKFEVREYPDLMHAIENIFDHVSHCN